MSRLQLPGVAKAGSADVIRRISPDKQHVKLGTDMRTQQIRIKIGSPSLGDLSRLQLPGVAKAGRTDVLNIYAVLGAVKRIPA